MGGLKSGFTMKERFFGVFFVALAVVLTIAGCKKEEAASFNEPGTEIVFGATTGWQNDSRTRTEYSGKDENDGIITGTSLFERIDWVDGMDRIRLLCDAAVGKSDPSDKTADYVVTGVSVGEDKEKSEAEIVPADDNSLHWGTEKHYFYALYPAPGMESNYNFTDRTVTESVSRIESITGNKAKITGYIPAVQEVVLVDKVYKPNMNYAYMYAATTATPGVPGSVLLSFNPLVTTFEFSLKALDDMMASKDLLSLSLKLGPTSSTYLSGGFTATLDYDGQTPVSIAALEGSSLGREITINFPEGSRLSKDDYSVVTVLTLGQTHTNLTLTLTFSGNETRSLALNKTVDNVSTPITVDACKKVYFKLGVPSDSYVLGSLSDVTVNYLGTAGTDALLGSGFVSYLEQGGIKVPIRFKLQYSPANQDGTCADSWNDNAPDWLHMDSGINYGGSVSGQNLGLAVDGQTNRMEPFYEKDPHAKRLYNAEPQSNRDLSRLNVATGNTVNRTTANCYVVQAPGTYRFPVVYGNSVQDGNQKVLPRYAQAVTTDPNGIGDPESTFPDSKGYYLGRFINHLDAQIGGCYIGSLFSESEMDACILWTDEEGLVTNVRYDKNTSNRNNDYISFAVPQATIRQGNALIAVLVDGKIAWSWHIWVTDRDLSPVTGPTSIEDDQQAYGFAPVNLGWCDPKTTHDYEGRKYYVRAVQVDEAGNPLSKGRVSDTPALVTQEEYVLRFGGNNPYYQWGRKDPLIATNGNSVTLKQYYDPDNRGKLPTWSAVSESNTLGYAIQHPNEAIYDPRTSDASGNVDANWCNPDAKTFYYNLWNYNVTTHGGQSEAIYQEVGKTIYDPSPVGYKVAPESAFSGFTEQNFPVAVENGDRGRKYNDVLFFPAMGTLGTPKSTGTIHGGIGSNARYWSASPDNPTNNYRGMSLRFTTTGSELELIVKNNNYRPTGQPVRPVTD